MWSSVIAAVVVLAGVPGPDAAAVKRLLQGRYVRYVQEFEQSPPVTLNGLFWAALSWSPLDKHGAGAGRIPDVSESASGSASGAKMSVQMVSFTIQGGKATAVVKKTLSGKFYLKASQKRGRIESSSTWRHVWWNTGDGWKLMTVVPVRATLTMNGKAFTPSKEFDPSGAFGHPNQLLPGKPGRSFPP